jgi:hypothetical protein
VVALREIAAGTVTAEMLAEPEPEPVPAIEPEPEAGFRAPQFGLMDRDE